MGERPSVSGVEPRTSRRDAELRALQARAYGRDADIERDPVALKRLAALESRGFEIVDRDAEDVLAELRTLDPEPEVERARSSQAPTSAPASDDSDETPSVSRLDRRRPFASALRTSWVAVGVACLATAAVTIGAVAWTQGTADPRVVATIGIDESGEWPAALGERQDGSAVFEDYLGITFVRNPQWTASDRSGEDCLLATRADLLASSDSFGGFQVGCSAGAFPAVVQFTVDSNAPDALQAEHPAGTALQFTLRGDAVEVRADG